MKRVVREYLDKVVEEAKKPGVEVDLRYVLKEAQEVLRKHGYVAGLYQQVVECRDYLLSRIKF